MESVSKGETKENFFEIVLLILTSLQKNNQKISGANGIIRARIIIISAEPSNRIKHKNPTAAFMPDCNFITRNTLSFLFKKNFLFKLYFLLRPKNNCLLFL